MLDDEKVGRNSSGNRPSDSQPSTRMPSRIMPVVTLRSTAKRAIGVTLLEDTPLS